MEPSRRKQTPKRPQAPQPVLQKAEGTEAVLQKVEGTGSAMGPWQRPVLQKRRSELPLRLSSRPLQPLALSVRNRTRSRCPCLGHLRWRAVKEGLRTKHFSPAEDWR